MNRFVVSLAYLAVALGAPSHYGSLVSAPVASAPAVVENRVEYGVVGARTVQTGVASVLGGHQYVVAGQESIPQPATSYVVGEPQNIVETRPIAPPAIPVAAPYAAAIPPAPVPAGFAPADTVTVQKIAAPVRSHVRITPQVTNIVPEVQVNKYNIDVPVAVPREIITHTHVAKPYEVAVPRAVPVPAPYKVHPVQEIVETPHIHHATVETHSTQAVVTAHATPVHAVAQAPVAVSHHVAAPVAGLAAAPVGATYTAAW